MLSIKDRQQIIELVEGRAESDTPEIIRRRIIEKLPHLTSEDVAEVCAVRAEECHLDTAEHKARASALRQVVDIVEEAAPGKPGITPDEALALLRKRVKAGDTRATESLNKLTKAITFLRP
jgi:hypothetical protein